MPNCGSFAAVSPLAMTGAASGEAISFAAAPLQLGQPADVIEMHVALEQYFHVLEAEAERADVGRNQVGPPCRAAVDQNVRFAGDQDRRDAAGPDVPAVAVDAIGRAGFVPVVPVAAGVQPRVAPGAASPAAATGTGTARMAKRPIRSRKSVTLQNDFLYSSRVFFPGFWIPVGRAA